MLTFWIINSITPTERLDTTLIYRYVAIEPKIKLTEAAEEKYNKIVEGRRGGYTHERYSIEIFVPVNFLFLNVHGTDIETG